MWLELAKVGVFRGARQYELHYVVGSERDLIGLRALFRKDPPENLYIYRIHAPLENSQRLLLAYLQAINGLKTAPEFYNTLTENCTTGIWSHSLINAGHVPLSWKVLLSGHVPEYLHAQKRLAGKLPFSVLQQASQINARARAAYLESDFSAALRRGLPGMPAPGSPGSPGSQPH